MKKTDETKPRNWVKKAVDELGLKPARHKDRKHDYDRAQRRRVERDWESEDSSVPSSRPKSKRSKRLRPYKDRSRDSEGELDNFLRLQQEEDSPDSEEV